MALAIFKPAWYGPFLAIKQAHVNELAAPLHHLDIKRVYMELLIRSLHFPQTPCEK